MSRYSPYYTNGGDTEGAAYVLSKQWPSKTFYVNMKPDTMRPGVFKVYTYWVSDTYGAWSYMAFHNGQRTEMPAGDE